MVDGPYLLGFDGFFDVLERGFFDVLERGFFGMLDSGFFDVLFGLRIR
jgi:hypothetical protein